MTRKTPTIAEVLEEAIVGALDDVRVMLPGRIESYSKSTRRASVQVLAADGFLGEDGARRTANATLQDVPVGFLGGRGGIVIGFDPEPGDQCWLQFSSSSIARIKATGRIAPYDPGDDRHHHIADAIAIPWVVVGDAGSAPLIWFDEFVRLGSASASEQVPRGTTYRVAEDVLFGLIVTALTTLQTAAPLLTGPALAITAYNSAMTALISGLTNFLSGAATYLSTVVKVP